MRDYMTRGDLEAVEKAAVIILLMEELGEVHHREVARVRVLETADEQSEERIDKEEPENAEHSDDHEGPEIPLNVSRLSVRHTAPRPL